MKAIFLSIAILAISSISHAQRNPQIRVCNISGGHFWALNLEAPVNDQYGFCRYDNSLMGSISLMEYLFEKRKTLAMNAYLKTKEMVFKKCQDAGADQVLGKEFGSDHNDIWQVCSFTDGSVISKNTLISGWNDEANKSLNEALLREF